jgi:hypothetical protein
LPFMVGAAARLMAPGRWRMVAGSAMALLLVGWIGLYQMGVPAWEPWTPRAEKVALPQNYPTKPVTMVIPSACERHRHRSGG